jgi:DNA-binding XRE family transcriptional regulator
MFYKENKMEYINNLSKIIKDNHHNTKSFADEVDSSRDAISQYANGHSQLPLKLALKICEKFNYSLDYIYNIECNGMMIDFRELLKF